MENIIIIKYRPIHTDSSFSFLGGDTIKGVTRKKAADISIITLALVFNQTNVIISLVHCYLYFWNSFWRYNEISFKASSALSVILPIVMNPCGTPSYRMTSTSVPASFNFLP